MIKSSLNILVYADVDMNLTDGSSIWLNSLVQVLAKDPGNRVHVMLKARVTKDLLLQDLCKLENVTLADPYKKFTGFNFQNKNRLVIDDAISLVNKMMEEQDYDWVILRGLEVCKKAIATMENPGIIIPYITGFSDDPDLISGEEKQALQSSRDNVQLELE